ncbi:hypothetical protein BgAZ_201360 [Babesia gibsoni]|uniref:Uncharacterized protein n=1 Tax=Babesia gibsoni TaxID=33632 RepID=A0AAD8LSQ9_BABGI|nr:hypothetical protein BgAZ_201360 [Babesia gibsoni]
MLPAGATVRLKNAINSRDVYTYATCLRKSFLNVKRNAHYALTVIRRESSSRDGSQSAGHTSLQVPHTSDSAHITAVPLDEGLERVVNAVSKKINNGNNNICVSVLSPPSNVLTKLLHAAFNNGKITVNMMPMDLSLLASRLQSNESTACYRKHVVDNWRSLMVEAGTEAVITTRDYYNLLVPICRELTLPLFVMTDRPTILEDNEFEGALKAGHGYYNLLNCPLKTEEAQNQKSADSIDMNAITLRLFSEINSCKAKAVVHTASTLTAEFSRIRSVMKLGKSDCVINCLFPHEYAYTVYGILYTTHSKARLHSPFQMVPSAEYHNVKPKFPLTSQRSMQETVALMHGKSVFDYVRHQKCSPTVLLCNSQSLGILLDFITCEDLSQQERNAYIAEWKPLQRIFVFDDISQLYSNSLKDKMTTFMETMCIEAGATRVYTLQEAGAICYQDIVSSSEVVTLPGCEIKEGTTDYTVNVSSGSLFKVKTLSIYYI